MKIEIERKYLINSEIAFNEMIKKSIFNIYLVQWYFITGERYRYIIYNNNKEKWFYNKKESINREIRKEIEKEINPDDVNLKLLTKANVVMKKRYIINSNPEIIIDNILNPNNIINYKKDVNLIKHLLEIEIMENKNYNFDEIIDKYLKNYKNSLIDVTFLEGFNNLEFAGETNLKPFDLIRLIHKIKKQV